MQLSWKSVRNKLLWQSYRKACPGLSEYMWLCKISILNYTAYFWKMHYQSLTIRTHFYRKTNLFIHLLHSVLQSQLRLLLIRFIKSSIILPASLLSNIDFCNRHNQLDDEDLFVGNDVREYISDRANQLALAQFYASVHSFYEEACK